MPACRSLRLRRPCVQVPLVLPTSLAPTLEGLHVMARGFSDDTRWLQHWGWLQPFSHLNSMRLQVGGGLGGVASEDHVGLLCPVPLCQLCSTVRSNHERATTQIRPLANPASGCGAD